MVFAGGATDSYRDSGLAQLKEGERAGVRDRTGEVVKLTVPPFTQVLHFPELGENKQDIKNTKEQVKPLFPLVVCFRLPQLNIKTIYSFVCLL